VEWLLQPQGAQASVPHQRQGQAVVIAKDSIQEWALEQVALALKRQKALEQVALALKGQEALEQVLTELQPLA
jgi:hypothetical protein